METLIILKGNPKECLDELIDFFDVRNFWNRCYEPWIIKRDKSLKIYLNEKIKVNSFNGSLLWEPWEILKNDGTLIRFLHLLQKRLLVSTKPKGTKIEKINFFNHNFRLTNI